LRAQRINDAIGRTTRYTEWRSDGTLFRRNDNTYSTDNLKTKEVTKHYKDNGAVDKTVTTNHTFDANGNMLSSINNDSTKIENYYRYDVWDNYKQSRATIEATSADELDSEWKPGYSDTRYDVNGNVEEVVDHYNARVLRYANNHKGQVLSRTEEGNGYFNQHNYYYLNGIGIGDVGNDGPDRTDYAMQLAASQCKQRYADDVKPVFSADFDANYQPIGPNYPAQSPGSYTVQGGEDLKSIALSVWGDASLWYLIADSNGLTGSESLPAGTELILPNKVTNIHNNSGTYRPYDPGVTLGDVGPTLPDAPPPPINADGGCGGAQIIVAVVAIVATVLTGGALASLATGFWSTVGVGAAAAAAGNVAGQLAGMALETQDGFSFSAVARSAVVGGLTAGVFDSLGVNDLIDSGVNFGDTGLAKFATNFVRAGAQSVVSQGINIAIGEQKKFSWEGIAVAGLGQGINGAFTKGGPTNLSASDQSKKTNNWDEFVEEITSADTWKNALGSAVINEGISAAVYRRDFDFAAVAQGAVGGAVGDAVSSTAAERKLRLELSNRSVSTSAEDSLMFAQQGMAPGMMVDTGAASLLGGFTGTDFSDDMRAELGYGPLVRGSKEARPNISSDKQFNKDIENSEVWSQEKEDNYLWYFEATGGTREQFETRLTMSISTHALSKSAVREGLATFDLSTAQKDRINNEISAIDFVEWSDIDESLLRGQEISQARESGLWASLDTRYVDEVVKPLIREEIEGHVVFDQTPGLRIDTYQSLLTYDLAGSVEWDIPLFPINTGFGLVADNLGNAYWSHEIESAVSLSSVRAVGDMVSRLDDVNDTSKNSGLGIALSWHKSTNTKAKDVADGLANLYNFGGSVKVADASYNQLEYRDIELNLLGEGHGGSLNFGINERSLKKLPVDLGVSVIRSEGKEITYTGVGRALVDFMNYVEPARSISSHSAYDPAVKFQWKIDQLKTMRE